jgi:hypothetical protein
MATIKELISNYLTIGYSSEKIIELLQQQGFSQTEMDEYMHLIQKARTDTVVLSEKKKKNIWKIISTVLIVVFIIIKYAVKCRAVYE